MNPLTSPILVVDAETGSPVDLKAQGMYRYFAHADTRTYMVGHQFLHDSNSLDLTDFETGGTLPRRVQEHISSGGLLAAFNAPFDRRALTNIGIETPDSQWLDIQVLAYYLGFAGRLNDVLRQVFPGDASLHKDAPGTRLITKFSVKMVPWYESPDDWQLFRNYCRQDARVEARLLDRLLTWIRGSRGLQMALPDVLRQEQIYRRINNGGIPVDLPAVRGALKIRDAERARLIDEMREITGLDNPNSRDQLLGWLVDHGAPMYGCLTKDSVRDALEVPGLAPEVIQVLKLRQELGKTASTKFDALANATSPEDARLRGGWQFYGASRTGRVAGRTLNPANLPRPMIKDPEGVARWLPFGDRDLLELVYPEKGILPTLGSAIRACVKAPKGKELCVADLSSIESVGGAWLAGCRSVLDIFHQGRDTYRTFAASCLGIPYDEVTKAQRTLYKPAVLGGFYRLSGYGLVAYAASMGIELDQETADQQIADLRATWHEIPQHWRNLDRAVTDAMRLPNIWQHVYPVTGWTEAWGGRMYIYGDTPRVSYLYDGKEWLFCRLPSGRHLCYYRPEIRRVEITKADGETFETDSLHYWGNDQKATGAKWSFISTHSGKLLENNCIAAGTPVMTTRGWVPIEDVQPGDAVWDGIEFVNHSGVLFNGTPQTIVAHGVRCTSDHLILTTEGWKHASESKRFDRAACRLPSRREVPRERRKEFPVGVSVRLREFAHPSRERVYEEVQQRAPDVVWLSTPSAYIEGANYTRNVEAPCFRGLAFDAGPVSFAHSPGVAQLRRARNRCLRKVGEVVRELLGGYGLVLRKGVDAGQDRQRRELLPGELSLGHVSHAGTQQAKQPAHSNILGRNDRIRGGESIRNRAHNAPLSARRGVPGGSAIREAGLHQPVYDILNCGPRNRFVVLGDDGPVIVHNCQAMCRDILWWGLEQVARDERFEVVIEVYDELGTLVDENRADECLDALIGYMTDRPPWLDESFYLGASGYISNRYKKD